MLPRVKINYLNGLIGAAPDNQDGLLLMVVVGAAAVGTTFELGKAYRLVSAGSLASLGVTATNNARVHELVGQFYAEAEEGTPLYVAGVSGSSMASACDVSTGSVKGILEGLRGAVRGLIVASAATTTPTVTEGLDPDVFAAVPKAQALADHMADDLYAPVFAVIEGRSYTASSTLKDLTELDCNRVAVFIGDTASGSKGAAVGTLAGRIASVPVQRNIGRVASGPLAPASMYLGSALVDDAMDAVDDAYAKGYITPRIYTGLTGYYFTDDCMAVAKTDDYAHLTARRTADKAARIAYATLLQFLLDEIEVNTDGTMQAPVLKGWQAAVETAVDTQMTANGELSVVDGSGCRFFIDATQNVLATSKVEGTLRVRPFGYAREIVANIGFLTNIEN